MRNRILEIIGLISLLVFVPLCLFLLYGKINLLALWARLGKLPFTWQLVIILVVFWLAINMIVFVISKPESRNDTTYDLPQW